MRKRPGTHAGWYVVHRWLVRGAHAGWYVVHMLVGTWYTCWLVRGTHAGWYVEHMLVGTWNTFAQITQSCLVLAAFEGDINPVVVMNSRRGLRRKKTRTIGRGRVRADH